MTVTNLAGQAGLPDPQDAEASLSPDELIARARTLSATLADEAAHWDARGAANLAAFDRIREHRIGAIRVPVSYGGAGGSIVDVAQAVIALAHGDSSVAQALLPHFVFVERTLLMAGAEQQARWLVPVARGALVGGASAERGAPVRGQVRTALRRDGDGFRLNGVKHYSTGALIGDLLKITAVGPDGDSVLVVLPPEREGIVRHDDWTGMGQRGTLSGTTELIEVRVEAHEVVHTGRWKTERHHTGAASQIIHCAIEAGIARAALDDMARWVRDGVRPVRESGVVRAADDPYILYTVGRIAARVRTAEVLVLRAAARIEAASEARHGGAPAARVAQAAAEASIATAEAKVIATEAALDAARALFDVGGASTTLRRHRFDRHWRNARTHTVHDPAAYKTRAIGDYHVNGHPPPIDYGY
ncbi:acyl-CoA dehydrogenase family protein [Burkholderia sp. 22PA0099]|uniref:acyl-CoA dehydrogenase family protein n=1 Tax=Burkholderia sp. 22PA0099 TaxID=3237372 RepID=UPI0039C143B8